MNKQFIHIDTCLSDYFRGHSNQVYQVPLHNGMTIIELFKELETEFNMYDLNEHSGYTSEELDKSFENFKFNNRDNLDKIAFPNLDIEESEDDDDYESVYAFFTVDTI